MIVQHFEGHIPMSESTCSQGPAFDTDGICGTMKDYGGTANGSSMVLPGRRYSLVGD